MKKSRKIFGIGFQKTGTSTLNEALAMLGYQPITGREKKDVWRAALQGGDPESLVPLLERWDAFEDNPYFWPSFGPKQKPFYAWAFDRFPDSRFILTVRKDSAVWKKSLEGHLRRKKVFAGAAPPGSEAYAKRVVVYGKEAMDSQNVDAFVRAYENYNTEARRFFTERAPGRFLEVCWENSHGWDELCGFLGCRRPWFRAFPHSNSGAFQDRRRQAR